MRIMTLGVFAALVVLAGSVLAADTSPPGSLHVVARIPGPDGGWDYASFDRALRRVYIAHGDVVLAIDAESGRMNPAFAQGDHLHAVVPVPGGRVLVTTNSGDGTAKVISAVDGRLLASIPTAKDADGARYDPKTRLVVVICGDAGVLTLIDPRAMKAVGTIDAGGPLEFGAPDGKGRFFVNLVESNKVAVVDLMARKVTVRYPLTDCHHPTGLAYVAGERVVSACADGGVNVLDARSGRLLAKFKVGGFPDAVIYDDQRHLALVPSAFSGKLTVIALSGPADNKIVETVPTQLGARTGAVDPLTGKVYLPSAEYGPVPAPGQRPKPKPGTFCVLVLDR